MTDDPTQTSEAEATSEPIDAEFREAPKEKKAKRGPGWFTTFVMMLLATAGGGALGYAGAERMPGLLGGTGKLQLPENLATQSEISDLQDAQARLAGETGDTVDALQQRTARLESDLEALQLAGDEHLDQKVATLTARLDAIETLPPGEAGAPPDALSRALASAGARIDRLEERLDESDGETAAELAALRRSMAELATEVTNSQAARLGEGNALAEAALALSTIDAAARRGQDFSAAFAVLQRVRPDAPAVAELASIAERGAPTLAELKTDFETLSQAIRAELAQTGDAGALGAAGRIFGGVVEVRSPEAADDFTALDEAGTALDRDDLGGAVAALSRLEGEAGIAAAEWISQAEARRSLERALDTLRLDLTVEDQIQAGTE